MDNYLALAIKYYENKQHDEAFIAFNQPVLNNDSLANYYLGLCYRNGFGTIEDQKQAFKHFLNAATLGHVESQYIVASIYRHEMGFYGGTVPSEEALKHYHQVEQNGTSTPYYQAMGIGVKPNMEEAHKWLLTAAINGHAQAQYELAMGIDYDEDEEIEFNWLQKAIDNLHLKAMNVLASYTKNEENDVDKAIELYQKSYELGDDKAAYLLGRIYENKNLHGQAFNWYTLGATESNDFEAQLKLGEYYEYGNTGEVDYDLALHWYMKAVETFKRTHICGYLSIDAIYRLYNTNLISTLSEQGMIGYMIYAARNGNEEYEQLLFTYFEKGIDIGEEFTQKFKLLNQARHGNKSAQIQFGYTYLLHRMTDLYIEEADTWFSEDALNNQPDAQYLCSQLFQFQLTEKNYVYYLSGAATNGHSEAQYILARYYLNQDESEEHITQTLFWYHEASKSNLEAQIDLGYFYGSGMYVKRNYREAYHYYYEAMNQFDHLEIRKKRLMNLIKLRYMSGNDEAEEKAFNGDMDAQLYLGILYQHGIEVQQNPKKAIFWFQKASKQGSIEANNHLVALMGV